MKDVDRARERSRHRFRDEEEEEESAKGLEKDIRNSEERERSRKGESGKERGDRDGFWKEESGREARERQRVRERERHRESRRQEKDRDAEFDGDCREKDRDSRHRDGKEKEKRERHRDDREREGERIRDRDKDELREREKLKERERKRRDTERGKERDTRDRREIERDREREWKEADEERERKRRRREDDAGRSGERTRERERQRDREPERELERISDKNRDEEDERERERRKRRKENDSGKVDTKVKEEVEEDDLEQEQLKLDEEMEKRRRRVQEWQELRRRKEEEERKKREDAGEAMEQPANIGKAWTLEGEESDEEDIPKMDDAKSKGESVSRVSAFENGDVVTVDAREDGAEESVKDGKLKHGESASENSEKVVEEEDELDPLDAFMNSMILPEVEKLSNEDALRAEKEKVLKPEDDKPSFTGRQVRKVANNATGRIIPGDDSASDEEEYVKEEDDMEEDDEEFMKRVKKSKAEKLAVVDHSKIQYSAFRKNFYIEVKEISRMSVEDVSAYGKQLELKIRGKDVPRPVKTWNQTGLSSKALEIIKKLGFEKPMSIQAQALPIIMSGRDCIGIAKTGSGKTLAFVLPMLRHIMDQPPLAAGDGPIGLIMAPTRELVQQIFYDIKKFTKVMGLSCVPVYGGSGVAQQISDLKRGTEIVVCSPGRMIDILCTSAGKITNLRRVTYFVLDEADRMFDMGFEPQITRIIQNTRPDRQTVLFSATFPRQVEVLARKVLSKPVEIQVGGRSVVNKDITQIVEVRAESERFLRLLELLGEWYEKGKILIFVHSQEKCDSLFKDLLKRGYPCLSLHGAKDQTDRESTISDFKRNVCNLLIATSIAARGLDVKELELVANYDVPNHYEDYVHRVGRTGRAGRKGFAVTFISEDEARYAPDLVKALKLSEQPVPEDLKKLADDFMARVNQGTEQAHCSGYGGSGFKFNEEEEEARKAAKKAQAREFGFEEDEDKSDSDSDDDGIRKAGGDLAQAAAAAALAVAAKAGLSVSGSVSLPFSVGQPGIGAATGQGVPSTSVAGIRLPGIQAGMSNITGLSNMAAIPSSAGIPVMSGMGIPGFGFTAGVSPAMPNEGAARAAALAAALNLQHNLAKIQADAIPEHYEAELEINDFPQHARWKVTHKDSLGPISEWTGAAITTRGQYVPAGKVPVPGERKLYLFIEGPTEASVKKAKTEIKRTLEESTAASISLPTGAQPGKYSVL